MPVVYRVKHDDEEKQERGCTFFAKKGEAGKFRRANKSHAGEVEQLKVQGRDMLCQLLNDPYGYEEEVDIGEF